MTAASVIARYLTVGGATVDITQAVTPNSSLLYLQESK